MSWESADVARVEQDFNSSDGRFSNWRTEPSEPASVYAPHQETQHKTSSFLRDRHPYRPEPDIFCSQVHSFEVATAFDRRGVLKLAALLAVEGLPDEKRLESLHRMLDLLASQEYKIQAIEDTDVVPTCTGLLSSDSAHIREYAARVLGSCSVLADGRAQIALGDTLPRLTALLTDEARSVREAASGALAVATSSRDGARQLLDSEEGVLLYLVAAIFDPKAGGELQQASPTVVFNAVAVVSNLTSLIDGRAVEKALAAGAVSSLKQLLEPVSAAYVSEELRVRVLNALWNISLQDVDDTCNGKQPIIKAGTVPLIVASVAGALGKATDVAAQLRRYGAGTLLSLSVDEECKVLLQERRAVTTLVKLLYDEAPTTRSNAVSTVHHVCESPSGLAIMAKELVADEALLVEVLAERAAQPVLNLLVPGSSRKIRAQASRAMVLLTSPAALDAPGDPSGPGQPVEQYLRAGWSGSVMQCVGCVDILLDAAKDPGCKDACLQALNNLVSSSPRATAQVKAAIAVERANADDFPEL